MSFGYYHPLPPQPPKEKYVFGLGIVEFLWMVAGAVASYKLFKVLPPLPINDFLINRIHSFLPLAVTSFFAFGKLPQTGLSIPKEIVNLIEFKMRKRILPYRRGKY